MLCLLHAYIGSNPDKFLEELLKLQEEATLDQKLSRLGRKRTTMRAGQFDLKCFRCGAFVCMSDSVKKIKDVHHVVVDEPLKERVICSDKDTRDFKDDDVQLCGKISCKECGGNLGVSCIYKSLEFRVLKIENCLVVHVKGRQTTCKQWMKVPFVVEALGTEDFKKIIKNRGENGQM
ncbi:hypothetical protein DPMN_093207 [Dreissena polymorpha]|uniref:RLR CTR domain-containing protein n=1 Tax=Dreissena polymorpha TaxID=45954 RepID=A0A9D4L3N6_DREPO|nr:hypothetical protein DPMN_093207 [Dreissena polymorpha]